MDEKVFNYIKEQIEFLKADLNREINLNPNSEFQPEAAQKIEAARGATRQQILQLLNRLAGFEPAQDDRNIYLQVLEKIASDRSSIEMAQEAMGEMDDDDCKQEVLDRAIDQYESTKRDIASKLLAKLG